MKIHFYTFNDDKTLPPPIPASRDIPEWYKKLDRYSGGEKRPSTDKVISTIKTCIPVLDSLTAGYLIKSAADLFIHEKQDTPKYEWAAHNLIGFHPAHQFRGYPDTTTLDDGPPAPKFNNPWVIETPKGYSCLFIPPSHRDLPFRILTGIVDTDTYKNPVNFPFIVKPDFEGLIPKGTVIAQVIPFKREAWKMSVNWETPDSKRVEATNKVIRELNTKFFDRYRDAFWTKKEYK